MRSFLFLKRYGVFLFVGVLAAFCALVWTLALTLPPRGVLTFAVLNVGQGDSLYIQGPTGIEVVVDGGPDNSLLQELPKVMAPFDRSLDAVIETHPDADHVAGFIDLLKRYHVGAFIEPGIQKDTQTAAALEQEIADEKIPRYIARRGMVLDLGGGAELDILFPDRDVSHINQNRDNDGGIVAHLVYGKTSVLLTADTSTVVEEHLLQIDPQSLHSDILKVAHHGSKYSSEEAYVTAVAPRVALISVGAYNTYGHPTKETLDTLARYNVQIFRTDKDGTLIFHSDGTTFVRVQ